MPSCSTITATVVVLIGVGLFGFSQWYCAVPMAPETDLSNRVILVTGANSGLGLATAKELARRNATVIVSARSNSKATSAMAEIRSSTEAGELIPLELDLSSLSSVREAASIVLQLPRLDVLVCNAGIAATGFAIAESGIEMQMQVNHVGHFLLSSLLLPMLERSSDGRIVHVSSGAYEVIQTDGIEWAQVEGSLSKENYNPFLSYGFSKFAQILFSKELNKRLAASGSKVSSIVTRPGAVDTSIIEKFEVFQQNPMWSKAVSALISTFARTPLQGAQTQTWATFAPELAHGQVGSDMYYLNAEETLKQPPLRSSEFTEALWNFSEKTIGQKFFL